MFPLAFVAGLLQGHWWGFISRNYVVWPTFLLMNVFIALKGSHFWFLFNRDGFRLVCPNAVLVGDINIDCTTISNTQLRDCLTMFNMSNVINEPTHILGNSSTLTDPIFVSESCCVLESGTIQMNNQISDHKTTDVPLKIHTTLSHSYLRKVWNYQNGDYAKLNTSIEQYDWDSIINYISAISPLTVHVKNSPTSFLASVKNAFLGKML